MCDALRRRFSDELDNNPLLAEFVRLLLADWSAADASIFLSNVAVVMRH